MKLEQKTIRTIIWIAVAIALAIAAWIVIRKVRQGSDDRKKRKDYARLAAELENAGASPAQLTSVQCENIAENIKKAQEDEDSWFGWGTDEKLMKSSFESIPTAADYLNVKAAYQKKYSSDMWTDVQREYSDGDSDLLILEKHLTKIAVPQDMW